jgi:hypothetical protein
MQDSFHNQVRELDHDALLLLVVGAHLEAELVDRVLAYRLRERIVAWQRTAAPPADLAPIVCTDLWYLNSDDLRLRPTIAIGRPEINAATAFLANRLPTAFVAEERFRIQFDPELLDLNVCLWGAAGRDTEASVELFAERYLDEYLQAAHEQAAEPGSAPSPP